MLGKILSFITIIFVTVLSVTLFIDSNKPLSIFHITNLMIMYISIINIYNDKDQPYSIKKMLSLFFLFFFGIGPLIQYQENTTFFGGPPISDQDYDFTNIFVVIAVFLFYVFYNRFRNKKIFSFEKKYYDSLVLKSSNITMKAVMIIVTMECLLCFLTLYFNEFNLYLVFVRESLMREETDGVIMNLLFVNIVRPAAVSTFLYVYLRYKNIFLNTLTLTCLLFVCFPFSMPRFATAAIYIPVMINSFKFLKKPYTFVISFVSGFLVLFPFLNQVRGDYKVGDLKLKLNFDMFNEGHFDSYNTIVYTLKYNLITYGEQLLGTVFFFIPRSIWTSKPKGSGEYMADKLFFEFGNVSFNYFAEGYVNFGYIGVFLFILIIAFLTARIDKIFWVNIINNKNNFSLAIYPCLMSLLFFLMRGDLLSSFAYTCGYIFTFFMIDKILKN